MRSIKNTYSKEKGYYIQEITGYEYFSKHMMNIIEECDRDIEENGTIPFEDWVKEMSLKYNVNF